MPHSDPICPVCRAPLPGARLDSPATCPRCGHRDLPLPPGTAPPQVIDVRAEPTGGSEDSASADLGQNPWETSGATPRSAHGNSGAAEPPPGDIPQDNTPPTPGLAPIPEDLQDPAEAPAEIITRVRRGPWGTTQTTTVIIKGAPPPILNCCPLGCFLLILTLFTLAYLLLRGIASLL